ncbi:integral membrane protein [Colletotrichum camelliae]|nr:integral membrane protein [Colletotrichum camelliae]
MAAQFPVTNGTPTYIPAPEGYAVDFTNPQSQKVTEHYAVFATLGLTASLCLFQRIYTKAKLGKGLDASDYLMVLAWVCSLVMQSMQVWSCSIHGLGHHAWEMSLEVWSKQALVSYIVAPVFICANGLTKTALSLTYFKFSPKPWHRRCMIAVISSIISYTVLIASMLLFGTWPIHANWDPYIAAAKSSFNSAQLYMAIAISNIVSDVVLFLFPIPMVLSLQMKPALKIGALIVFAVASLTVITSVVRLAYLPPMLQSVDTPWVAAPANVWSHRSQSLQEAPAQPFHMQGVYFAVRVSVSEIKSVNVNRLMFIVEKRPISQDAQSDWGGWLSVASFYYP